MNKFECVENLNLQPGEKIIEFRPVELFRSTGRNSVLQALAAICNVPLSKQLGKNGPPFASISLKENKGVAEVGLYEALFGRDSLRTLQFLDGHWPKLADVTFCALGSRQGTKFETASEEEPGRIPHEIRSLDDPIAQRLSKEQGWGWPYYGSIDATPMFVIELAREAKQRPMILHLRTSQGRPLIDVAGQAVGWILRRLEQSPSGLLESTPAHSGGIENQVWKDSWDSYHHHDGTVATPGTVSSVDVAALTFDALLAGAELAATYGWKIRPSRLREEAERVRERALKLMWVSRSNGGWFAIGSDRDPLTGKQRCLEIKTSNMGHVLDSRMLMGEQWREHVRAIAETLVSSELLAKAGVRTLSVESPRFSPGAYHNGTVWPWDSHTCARGLLAHGYREEATDLFCRLLRVVQNTGKFPEYVRGDRTAELNTHVVVVTNEENRIWNAEQPPQEVQGWTVAAAWNARRALSRLNRSHPRR